MVPSRGSFNGGKRDSGLVPKQTAFHFLSRLLYPEFANVIWKHNRFRGLTNEESAQILSQFLQIGFTVGSSVDLLRDAFAIASKYNRSVYDSVYVALSIKENCPFVTADEKLAGALQNDISNAILLRNWNA
ncbi:MAG: type II toxin-antitoxin system VapC family toxin [Planctomycetes bacterium]|nr:type II toxin-antitoxin system VapC family toxin [Planctomycetota bacterium]